PLSVTVTWKVLLAAMPVTVPVRLTPAAASLRLRILSPAIGVVIATVGKVSATVTLWVAIADGLPLASVTWADTVAVPLASASASVEGSVALQPALAAFTLAVELLVTPLSATVTWKVLLAVIPVTVPVSGTPPAAFASAKLITLLPSTSAIVTASPRPTSSQLTVACADDLPLASVTWTDTVAVPLARPLASVDGILALQLVPPSFPTRRSSDLTPLSATVTWKVLLAAIPVTVPVSGTPPAAFASAKLITLLPSTSAIVTAGPVSAKIGRASCRDSR